MGNRLHWDALTEFFTRARLAQAEGLWPEAHTALSEGVEVATACGDRLWRRRMQLTRGRCLGIIGRPQEACADIKEAMLTEAEQFEGLPRYYGALAASSSTIPLRASQHLARAVRVARAIPDATLTHDLLLGMDPVRDLTSDAAAVAPAPDVDSAIALIELGGHPRILGREALAVLDAAGCARALALVADGAAGPRVIEACGWTEAEAAAAAATPDRYDLIPLGRHRDEPWQLVVDPRPELDHRCTLIAIRKLIGTALTLDRYRREEKQRAALWPAEALDGDPESIWVSEQMAELLSVARRIAPTPLSILLTGETGTGKEMLARAIHRASDRASRPLLPFNCTAVPRDMLESQLFGYRKGRLHRRRHVVPRRHPLRGRRHPVSRRDRRRRSGDPAEAPALPRDRTRFTRSASRSRSRSTSGSSPRPTPTSSSSSPTAASAKTSSTASTSSASSCRRCASGARRSPRS